MDDMDEQIIQLFLLVRHPDESIRFQAAHSLGHLCKGVLYLLQAIANGDSSVVVRESAKEYLEDVRTFIVEGIIPDEED